LTKIHKQLNFFDNEFSSWCRSKKFLCSAILNIKKYGQNPILTPKEKENPTNQELPINKKKHLKIPFFF